MAEINISKLQRALFDAIVSQSELTKEGAEELALLIDNAMIQDIKEHITF